MKPIKVIGFTLAILGLYAFGFSWRDLQRGQLPKAATFAGMVSGKSTQAGGSPAQLVKQHFGEILADYSRPLKAAEVKYAAMAGAMASLGDPHTVFMEPRSAEDFQQSTTANFVGVGARLSPDPLGAKAVAVFEDGPAFASGIRINDIVTSVDGKTVAGQEVDKIVAKIKGPEGTSVRLTVLKSETGKSVNFLIKRAQITIPTVEAKYFEKERVGYLSIAQFSEPTAQQFDRQLSKLEQQPLRGLVIDVRGNPGGLLESAVDLVSRFTGPGKTVVKMKARDQKDAIARTYGGVEHTFKYPVTVLMNSESASAAEIFAGCLRDYQLATLVGEHSYGKASVQQLFEFRDRSFAKITIARYFLPSGEDISRKVDADGVYVSGGIAAEEKVDISPDADIEFGAIDKDPQLKRAIELIAR
jgi:carboxyl-terminal processing protease